MIEQKIITELNKLNLWEGNISLTSLDGGITNQNFIINDGAKKFVLKLSNNIPEHHILSFNVLAASKAAYLAGLSPKVIHANPNLTIMEYIESKTFTPKDICTPDNLKRILPLIKACHHQVSEQFRGPALAFWVFHVIRDYAARLISHNPKSKFQINQMIETSKLLEAKSAPFDIVFCHNDLLAANILDDGERLWLIDWDYAGFNSPLFDLGGLASNNDLSQQQEIWLLENYFEKPATNALIKRYSAMKCASLLRETMWSMVSQINPTINFDYATYTANNLARFELAYNNFLQT